MGHNSFLKNVSIAPTNKTDGKNPKKREDYWRRTFKTYLPFGHIYGAYILYGASVG